MLQQKRANGMTGFMHHQFCTPVIFLLQHIMVAPDQFGLTRKLPQKVGEDFPLLVVAAMKQIPQDQQTLRLPVLQQIAQLLQIAEQHLSRDGNAVLLEVATFAQMEVCDQ